MSPLTNPALIPPGAAAPVYATSGVRQPSGGDGTAETRPFADLLSSASEAQAPSAQARSALHFSKHAMQRVERRGISLDLSTLSRLSEGVGRAAGKGSRDSVVLVDGTAFVVSVSNRTVLTAVPQDQMKDQVFTNIDSAVIA